MVLQLYKDQKTGRSDDYEMLINEIEKRDRVITMMQEEIAKLTNTPPPIAQETPEKAVLALSNKLNCDIRLDYNQSSKQYTFSAYLEDSTRVMSQLCPTIKEAADSLIDMYEVYHEAQFGV
jgi:hypothetical protein